MLTRWLICLDSFFQFNYILILVQAELLQLNPLYLVLPATVATSFALMLPVAAPPNAIVFAYGHMKIIDMVIKCFNISSEQSILKVLYVYCFYDFKIYLLQPVFYTGKGWICDERDNNWSTNTGYKHLGVCILRSW